MGRSSYPLQARPILPGNDPVKFLHPSQPQEPRNCGYQTGGSPHYTEQGLSLHSLSGSRSSQFKCKYCTKDFKHESTKCRHEKEHWNDSYACTKPGFVQAFKRRDSLIRHLQLMHGGSPPLHGKVPEQEGVPINDARGEGELTIEAPIQDQQSSAYNETETHKRDAKTGLMEYSPFSKDSVEDLSTERSSTFTISTSSTAQTRLTGSDIFQRPASRTGDKNNSGFLSVENLKHGATESAGWKPDAIQRCEAWDGPERPEKLTKWAPAMNNRVITRGGAQSSKPGTGKEPYANLSHIASQAQGIPCKAEPDDSKCGMRSFISCLDQSNDEEEMRSGTMNKAPLSTPSTLIFNTNIKNKAKDEENTGEGSTKLRRGQPRNMLGNRAMLASHVRTKTGCKTCRQRKKKCDEGRPECEDSWSISWHIATELNVDFNRFELSKKQPFMRWVQCQKGLDC